MWQPDVWRTLRVVVSGKSTSGTHCGNVPGAIHSSGVCPLASPAIKGCFSPPSAVTANCNLSFRILLDSTGATSLVQDHEAEGALAVQNVDALASLGVVPFSAPIACEAHRSNYTVLLGIPCRACISLGALD